MTRIIHVNDLRAREPGVVYIGRRVFRAGNPIARVGSPWANPFRIGAAHPITGEPMDRDMVVALFDALTGEYAAVTLASIDHVSPLYGQAAAVSDHVRQYAGDLADATLACWCTLGGKPLTVDDPWVCHGQSLARAASLALA